MKVTNRGLSAFSTIWQFCFPALEEIENVKWDETNHVEKLTHDYLTAIFKIKWK